MILRQLTELNLRIGGTLRALFVGLLLATASLASSQIKVDAHFDKDHYLAGEPVFLIWVASLATIVLIDNRDRYRPSRHLGTRRDRVVLGNARGTTGICELRRKPES